MAELAAGNTAMIYNASTSVDSSGESQENPAYTLLKFPMQIGNIIEDVYYGGEIAIIIALAYLFGVFFTAELLRVVKRKYWAAINAWKERKSS